LENETFRCQKSKLSDLKNQLSIAINRNFLHFENFCILKIKIKLSRNFYKLIFENFTSFQKKMTSTAFAAEGAGKLYHQCKNYQTVTVL